MNVDEILLRLKEFDPINPDLQIELCHDIGKNINDENRELIIDSLIGLLDKRFPACTRADAIEEIGKIKSDKSQAALRLGLKDSYRLVRSYAVRALGEYTLEEYKDKSLIDDLKKVGLNDAEFFGVMAESAEALKKICKDVLRRRHDDKECLIIMNETIPLILQKANEKRDMDPRYPQRVGREAKEASEELKEVLQEFNNRLSKLLKETPKSKLEEIKNNKDIANEMHENRTLLLSIFA